MQIHGNDYDTKMEVVYVIIYMYVILLYAYTGMTAGEQKQEKKNI
jgi:hypothetical protein